MKKPTLLEFAEMWCKEKKTSLSPHHKKMIEMVEKSKKDKNFRLICMPMRIGKNTVREIIKQHEKQLEELCKKEN